MPVAELMDRISYPEMLHWIAFYNWESEQQTSPGHKPKPEKVVRAHTKEQASAMLDLMLKMNRN